MSANSVDYAKMFGTICDEAVVMAKCACVACNSCTWFGWAWLGIKIIDRKHTELCRANQ